jgi:hypothetical protein
MADFSWLANDPTGPEGYNAMQMRQRIAMAMLSGNKRGYPKNIGEGLSSIGDSIGDALAMKMMLRQQAALEAQRKAGKAETPPPEPAAAPAPRAAIEEPAEPLVKTASLNELPDETPRPAPDAPDAASLAVPMPRQAVAVNAATPSFPPSQGFPASTAPRLDPTVIVGTDPHYTPAPRSGPTTMAEAAPWLRDSQAVAQAYPGPQASPVRSDAADGYTYPQTAMLTTGDTMSDAPPVGIRRDSIARTISGQEVPPANPTQAAATPPTSLPPTSPLTAASLGSPPEARTNRPIVSDIAPVPVPGAQMAQATMTRPQPLTPQPTPPVQAPNIYAKPVEPPRPDPIPPSAAQQWYEAKKAREEDPVMRQYYSDKIAPLEAARAQREAIMLKEYESTLAGHNAAKRAWEEAQRNMGKSQAETVEAQAKALTAQDAQEITRRTGLPADAAITKFDNLKKGAEKDAYALQQLRIAKEAINNGIVSGLGGEFRVNLERAKAFFGDKSAAELAARSEQYLTAVRSTVGNQLQNIQPGDPRVTNADINLASGMIGADLKLQRATQMKLINTQLEDVHKRVNQYEDLKDHYLGGSKLEKMYDVQFDPIHPNPKVMSAYTDALVKNANDPAVIREFNQKFGPGAAEVEIGRARRAERRRLIGGQ